jgi:hypothetical protein
MMVAVDPALVEKEKFVVPTQNAMIAIRKQIVTARRLVLRMVVVELAAERLVKKVLSVIFLLIASHAPVKEKSVAMTAAENLAVNALIQKNKFVLPLREKNI